MSDKLTNSYWNSYVNDYAMFNSLTINIISSSQVNKVLALDFFHKVEQ